MKVIWASLTSGNDLRHNRLVIFKSLSAENETAGGDDHLHLTRSGLP